VPSFCLIYIKIWTASIDFNLKNPKQNSTKIRPVGVEMSHADKRLDVLCISLICDKECHNSKFGIFELLV